MGWGVRVTPKPHVSVGQCRPTASRQGERNPLLTILRRRTWRCRSLRGAGRTSPPRAGGCPPRRACSPSASPAGRLGRGSDPAPATGPPPPPSRSPWGCGGGCSHFTQEMWILGGLPTRTEHPHPTEIKLPPPPDGRTPMGARPAAPSILQRGVNNSMGAATLRLHLAPAAAAPWCLGMAGGPRGAACSPGGDPRRDHDGMAGRWWGIQSRCCARLGIQG